MWKKNRYDEAIKMKDYEFAGCYIAYQKGKAQYVGESKNVRTRLKQHHEWCKKNIMVIATKEPDWGLRRELESKLTCRLSPPTNPEKCKKCKSALIYIRLSKKERVCRSCGHVEKMDKEKEK